MAVSGARSLDDLVYSVFYGEINFSPDPIWIMGSYFACYTKDVDADFAPSVTERTGVTTIAATGYVEPEIVNDEATGNLTMRGAFIKTENLFSYA